MADPRDNPAPGSDQGPIPIEPEGPGAPHIQAPGLLEEFDEDADFDRDPEVEKAVKGDAPPPAAAEPIDTRPILVKAGWDDPRMMAGFGAAMTLGAMVSAWITVPEGRHGWLAAVLTLYEAAVHTGTGIVAVIMTAVFTEKAVGRYAQAAARMFVAVSFFLLAFHLAILSKWKTEEILIATAGYVGIVWGTFRLKRDPLLILCGCHFALWLLTWIGMWLAQVASVPVPPK